MQLSRHAYQMVCSSPGHFHDFFLKIMFLNDVFQLILGFWTASSNTISHLFQVSYLHWLPCCPMETEFPCCSGVMWKDGFGNLLSWDLHGKRMKSMTGGSSCMPCGAMWGCKSLSQFRQMPKGYSLLHSQKDLQRDRNVSVELDSWPGCGRITRKSLMLYLRCAEESFFIPKQLRSLQQWLVLTES